MTPTGPNDASSHSIDPRVSGGFPSYLIFGIAGLIIWVLMVAITWLGPGYDYDVPNEHRPILLVTLLWILASIVSLIGLCAGLRCRVESRDLFLWIAGFAIAFRLVQLFAPPFQEIDLYRYVWDGIVVSNGHSPYRYSPQQVLSTRPTDSVELKSLRKLALRSESTHRIVARVHFGQYTTIYPPVSQVVFAGTSGFLSKDTSVRTYLFIMKAVITAFDLAVLFLLAYLLSLLKLPIAWSIAYGWNPLVVKEYANSGHLDSIAVFFVMLAVVFWVRFFIAEQFQKPQDGKRELSSGGGSKKWLLFSATALAMGFGAKVYPLIVAPFFIVLIWKISGWRKAIGFGLMFLLVASLVILPMAVEMPERPNEPTDQQVEDGLDDGIRNNEGLSTFLKMWQINELAFMVVFQNLREVDPQQKIDLPWFRILPENVRQKVNQMGAGVIGPLWSPMLMSRLITLSMFGFAYAAIVFWVCWRLGCAHQGERFEGAHVRADVCRTLSGLFWVLAIFFCLQPTQNPWYWTWALPFIPFTRNRIWILYSTVLLIYYLRFALSQMEGPFYFLGYPYTGTGFFDFVLVWLEHLPIFFGVLVFAIWQWKSRASNA